MLLTRKFGKILRGKATAPQVVLAAVLGATLGFVPGFFLPGDLGGGFVQAPGLILALLFAVLVLNANLAVFGLVTLLTKLLSLPLLGVSFEIGRWLLDGPLQPLFRALVNSPVTAWFGLEHYATTGGATLGFALGLLIGIGLWRTLQAFRRRMAGLEESSGSYQRLAGKRSFRLVAWLLFGGDKRGKLSFRELHDRHEKGLPVRIAGVVAVVIVAVGAWLAQGTLAGPLARNAMQSALQSMNGATCDLAGVEIDLAGGSMQVSGLALANADDLARDDFRARTMALDFGTGELLRKRLVIDSMVSSEASHGMPRETPGQRIGPTPPPLPPPPPGEGKGKTLDDYVAEAQKWKERLTTAARWLERLSQPGGGEEETEQQRSERIEREKQDDVTAVRADHLLELTPLVLLRSLRLEGLAVADTPDDLFDVVATNLSTDPSLVHEPMTLSVSSRSGRYRFEFSLAGGRAELLLAVKGLDAGAIGSQLALGGTAPMQGGELDASIGGAIAFDDAVGFTVDLPLQVTLRGTTLDLYGLGATSVDEMTLPLGIRGPIANPRITVDDKKLADALVAAGRKELADQVRARAQALLEGLPMPGGGAVGGAVGDLIEGNKTPEQLAAEAKAAAEEEARKRAAAEMEKQKAEAQKKAAEELNKRLPGGITDIFGRKKDG